MDHVPRRIMMLVCDLDGTLLGDDEALGRFAEWYGARRAGLRLVYASGRCFASVRHAVATTALPAPEAVIADVGAEIRLFAEGEPLGQWQDRFCGGWDARRARGVLASFDALSPQGDEFQSAYKVSYHVADANNEFLRRVRLALRQATLQAEVIYSSRRDLDVLPAGADKGSAAAWIARRWSIPRERVLVFGDSGNDATLFVPSFRGTVVGNAQPELAALAGPHIYRSPRCHADGVLDGLRHWLVGTPAACAAG
ncbi:MAG TPA: HAD-IIB family hydrolase [Pirellulales bacterium]|nr:HAD-IIB family hydrolase [Pirellulales bacterium]